MHGYRPLLAELFLGLVDLTDEVDESLARLGHSLLRPVGELELSDGSALAVPGVRHLGGGDSVVIIMKYIYHH